MYELSYIGRTWAHTLVFLESFDSIKKEKKNNSITMNYKSSQKESASFDKRRGKAAREKGRKDGWKEGREGMNEWRMEGRKEGNEWMKDGWKEGREWMNEGKKEGWKEGMEERKEGRKLNGR